VSLTNGLGRGTVVRRNTIHGTFNGIGPCGSAQPPGAFTSETDVYDNELSEHTDDAFEPEGWCANVRLWGNRVSDVHMAFAVAPAAPGPTWIVRNVVWRHGNTRTSQQDGYTASVLKINSGYADPVGPLLLYHNTVVTDAPGTDAVALLNPGYSTIIRSRNNVLAGTQYVLYKVNPVASTGTPTCCTRPTRRGSCAGRAPTTPPSPRSRAAPARRRTASPATPTWSTRRAASSAPPAAVRCSTPARRCPASTTASQVAPRTSARWRARRGVAAPPTPAHRSVGYTVSWSATSRSAATSAGGGRRGVQRAATFEVTARAAVSRVVGAATLSLPRPRCRRLRDRRPTRCVRRRRHRRQPFM
jgi:hypothetical protein